jgi:hypothetical protein
MIDGNDLENVLRLILHEIAASAYDDALHVVDAARARKFVMIEGGTFVNVDHVAAVESVYENRTRITLAITRGASGRPLSFVVPEDVLDVIRALRKGGYE